MRFFVHDVSTPWPIPDQHADLVLDSLVLEHVADLEGVFRQAWRVLRPGGVLDVCELHPFRQLTGGKAHFVDPSTGAPVDVPAVPHDVSDFINAGVRASLRVAGLEEWRGADATSGAVPVLLTARFTRD